jgi:hypothetical protein
MLVPAQELMLWCDMMEMDMTEHHEAMTMQVDSTHSQNAKHCNVSDFGSTETPSDIICEVKVDCNCVSVQNGTNDYAVLGSSTVGVQIPVPTSILNISDTQYSLKVQTPPPIWSFASYSPPDLFLANESFLI